MDSLPLDLLAHLRLQHPFNTVITRMQAAGSGGRFNGPLDCFRSTVRNEGVLALYKGVTPPLFLTGIVNSVMFGIQNSFFVPAVRQARYGALESQMPISPVDAGIAALGTGFCVSFLVTPMEGIKTRLQVQYGRSGDASRYQGPIDCAKKVFADEGLRRGIYRGWTAVAFCRMSNWSYFLGYEQGKQWFRSQFGAATTMWGRVAESSISGSVAGIWYWFSCYPADVIKSRWMASASDPQAPFKSIGQCASHIWRTGGIRGFFVGFTPCLMRAVPANAACFTTYEAIMAALPK